jgi:hypothetical protein
VAPFAINIFGFQVQSEFFGVHGSSLPPGFVIVIQGGNKRRAFLAGEPAVSYHFRHASFFFSVKISQFIKLSGIQHFPDSLDKDLRGRVIRMVAHEGSFT